MGSSVKTESNLKDSSSKKINFAEIIKRHGILFVFLLMIIGISLRTDSFLTQNNMLLVLRQVSVKGIIACGMTYMLIGGEFDLSVGSLVSLTAVLVIDFHDILGPFAAIIIAILAGISVGAFNGFLVGFLKLNSLIVTFGMLFVIQALTLLYTGGQYVSVSNQGATWFSIIGRGFIFGIPIPVIIFGIILIIFGVVLSKTVYGRYLYSVGGNPIASKFSGIPKTYITFSTFIITGLTAAIGGIILGSRLMSAQNYLGQGYEFDIITAVVLGGTSLFGGSGSIPKTLIGVLILGFLSNGFIMMGFPYYVQWVVQWAILIGAVWMDVASKRGKILA
ncbi:ABC transporter permease [Fuchsiella alkaliacetigena]|uniref:ABC transporter permease n=1 Tax=Fuchsiella alkaliacetigena TaxID=957042 RepID=UPI00200B4C90|nr:ABC transporter permease [Fuchsiella alkaliacetigena]MCK8824219.1 ABC transporter permease [Fuchsiella alkaliacetigena]